LKGSEETALNRQPRFQKNLWPKKRDKTPKKKNKGTPVVEEAQKNSKLEKRKQKKAPFLKA